MAFPTVQDAVSTDGTSASATATVNIPAVVAGDAGKTLIVIHRSADGTADHGYPAGWTRVISDTSDGSDDRTSWAWRKCTGDEATTISISQTSSKYSSTAYLIAGATDPTVRAPESGTIGTGSSVNPNPGSTTPTGGAKDYLWIAVATYDNEGSSPTYPASYDTGRVHGSSGSGGVTATNCRTSSATRPLNATFEDPGNYSIGGLVVSNWTAFTIAVHPQEMIGEEDQPVIRRVPDERTVTVYA